MAYPDSTDRALAECALLLGSFFGDCLARNCLLRRRFWVEALRKHLLACRSVPFLVLLVGDLPLDKQLGELSALRLALEGHCSQASKRQAQRPHSASRVDSGLILEDDDSAARPRN